jgi:peptide/nickel transport system permease protein
MDPRRRLWRSFSGNRGAVVGLVVLCLILVLALIGPRLVPYDPFAVAPQLQVQPPSLEHPFGTDQFGRDVASRVLHGAPLSLQLGLIAVGLAASFGIVLGVPAGYFGGWLDLALMRCIDVLLAFPSIMLAMGIVSLLGPSLNNAMIAVGISALPVYVRMARAAALTVRTQPYLEAGRVIGCGNMRLMLRYVLPNVLTPLVIVATLGIASAILTGAALSFLGLGAQPPTPEWGAMLTDGRSFMRVGWWLTTFPGVAIMLTVLSINLVGDGLRDALDPRMQV